MSFLDPAKREINIKIAYYGPPGASLAGNLQYIHSHSGPAASELSSRATETEQFLFFNFVPQALGEIRGFKIRLHLFTVVGQSVSADAYRILLKGADGIVFVAEGDPRKGFQTPDRRPDPRGFRSNGSAGLFSSIHVQDAIPEDASASAILLS